jgi:hypothetical protein
MFVIDTNILVYAADSAAAEYEPCSRLLSQARSGSQPWFLTWGIIYEFLRVTTHPRIFPKPLALGEAWEFLNAALASPAASVLQETDRHSSLLEELATEVTGIVGNLVFDAHTATLMREHGIRRIYTRDAHFRRFPFLEVINPLV